jgi:hypothetical protein
MMALKRARATAFFTVLWAMAWGTVGALIGAFTARSSFPEYRWTEEIRFVGVFFGVAGAITGLGFAVGIMAAARRRSLDAVSFLRVAIVGALAGEIPTAILLALSAIWTVQGAIWTTVITAALGAACGSATLAIARAGDRAAIALTPN